MSIVIIFMEEFFLDKSILGSDLSIYRPILS